MIFSVQPKETVSMHTRDGVRLDADVYRPNADGKFPVLLMRQPYGRAIASTVVYAHPIWYAAHGYIVVIQDVRGRGSSEGDFDLFAYEIEDGEDSVWWASTLPGSTGEVGMYGFSYQGMTQLYAAANRPAPLKTICPAMIGYDLYADWAYEGGAFCLQANLGWAMQLAAETTRRKGDIDAYTTLYTAARGAPACDPVSGYSKILTTLAPDSFYHDWLQHPEPDAYWEHLSPKQYIQAVDMPMLHIGGWYDTYLRGTLRFYKEMTERSQHPQHLWVGPWGHIPWGRKVGAVDFGDEATSPIDALQIQWFDQFLKGKSTGMLDQHPVQLFEMGSNQWRSLPDWPQKPETTLFLASIGLASMSEQAGKLIPPPLSVDITTPKIPVPDDPLPDIPIADVLVHDPWRPVLAQGGHSSLPSGPFDRAALDCRSDVLTYTSAPFTDDWHLSGDIALDLACSADVESFDLCAVLSILHADGRAINVTQGYTRIHQNDSSRPDKPTVYSIQLQATCIGILKGQALRLSISGASFPAYSVNSGQSLQLPHTHLMEAKVITLMIWTGMPYGSKIRLSTPR